MGEMVDADSDNDGDDSIGNVCLLLQQPQPQQQQQHWKLICVNFRLMQWMNDRPTATKRINIVL
jgi:hypothetical protein